MGLVDFPTILPFPKKDKHYQSRHDLPNGIATQRLE